MKKYENFVSALANLEDAPNQDLNNDFVQSGLINKFNLQFELSWKLLKRLLEYEGATLAASGVSSCHLEGVVLILRLY